jgi:hypothetical protein
MPRMGNIALAKNHDGRMELVAMLDRRPEQESSSLLHRWQKVPDGEWTPWEAFGEPAGGSGGYGPAVVRNSDGRLEVVANDVNGAAWHRWQRRESGWSGWDSFDDPPVQGKVAYHPTLVHNGDGRLELFTRGGDGAVWHRWQRRPSGWSAWSSLEHPPEHPMIDGGPMVARNRNWRLELFVVIDGVVWTRSQRAEGGWSDWEQLGAPEGQEVSWVIAAQTRERSVNLFTGGSKLFQRWQFFDGSGWGLWSPLANPPDAQLVQVGAHADGRLVLIAVESVSSSLGGITKAVWQLEQRDAGGWGRWETLSENPVPDGEPLESSTLALNAKGQLELWFTIQNTMDLYRLKQTTPNGTEWYGERLFNEELV